MLGQWFFVNDGNTKRRRATMAKAARDPKSGRYRKRRSSRRSSARNPGAGKMANKPKRRSSRGKGRKPSYRRRRNPPRLNIIRTVQRGVQDGVAVVVGKALARVIPAQVKLPTTGAQGLAVQGLTAVGIALLAERFGLGKDFARFAAAGAFAAPIESFIREAGIPVISAGLSDYPRLMAYPTRQLMPGVASYPEVEYESGMGEYAEANGAGRYVEVYP